MGKILWTLKRHRSQHYAKHMRSATSQELLAVGSVASSASLGETSVDLVEILGGSLQVLSASLLSAFNAELSAVFHNPNVVVADWDVLTLDGVDEGSWLAVVDVIGLDQLLLVLLDDEAEVLDLSIRWFVGFWAVISFRLKVLDSLRFLYSGLGS